MKPQLSNERTNHEPITICDVIFYIVCFRDAIIGSKEKIEGTFQMSFFKFFARTSRGLIYHFLKHIFCSLSSF